MLIMMDFSLIGKALLEYLTFLGPYEFHRTRKQNLIALFYNESQKFSCFLLLCLNLWIKNQLEDFGVVSKSVPLIRDNTRALNSANNPIQHKRKNHLYIQHHFLRDSVEKGFISMQFCRMEDQVANIFTKALGRKIFKKKIKLGLV